MYIYIYIYLVRDLPIYSNKIIFESGKHTHIYIYIYLVAKRFAYL